jgi:hypothetical protein
MAQRFQRRLDSHTLVYDLLAGRCITVPPLTT